MRIKLSILFIISIFLFVIYSCNKDELQANPHFEAQINNELKTLSPKVSVNRGIVILAGYLDKKDLEGAVVITVKGDKTGKYRQVYDYKTGVSVTECGLTYKALSRSKQKNASGYYVSYEGNVIIDKINYNKRIISGSYNFKVRSVPDKKNEESISGKFINISF